MQGVPHLSGLPAAVHGCAYCGKDTTALPGIGWLPAVRGCNVCGLDRGGLAGKQKPQTAALSARCDAATAVTTGRASTTESEAASETTQECASVKRCGTSLPSGSGRTTGWAFWCGANNLAQRGILTGDELEGGRGVVGGAEGRWW